MILSHNQTMNSIVYRRLRLCPDYHLINSNHLFGNGSLPYLKHHPYQQQLEYTILHSDGGATLITGFRGVGKTTMVYNALNHIERSHEINIISIPIILSSEKTYSQILVEIIRKLHETVSGSILWSNIDSSIKNRLILAYKRTSYTIKQTNNTLLEADTSAELPVSLLPTVKFKGHHQRNVEKSFLTFSDNDAEYELIQCLKLLHDENSNTKVIIVIDEIDKITATNNGISFFDSILGQLKNLVCSTSAYFIFVAGIEVYKRWENDCQRINSLYSSIFTHHIYLPCIWDSIEELFSVIEDKQYVFKPINDEFTWMVQNQYTSILEPPFKMLIDFLLFKGKGLPRKIINVFNDFVTWDTQNPSLQINATQSRAIQQCSKLMKKFYQFTSSEEFGTIYERDLVFTLFLSMLDYLLLLEQPEFTQDDMYHKIVDQQGEMSAFFFQKIPDLLSKFCELSLIKPTENRYRIVDNTILLRDQSLKTLDSDLVIDDSIIIQSLDHPDFLVNKRFHAQIKHTKSAPLIDFWSTYIAEKILVDNTSMMVFQVKKSLDSSRHYALLYKVYEENETDRRSKAKDNIYSIGSYKIDSPYFIDTHDFIESGKPIVSLRSAVSGYSLAHLIESQLQYNAIYSIMVQILNMLANLHKQGYGNIRLTPDNILLCKDCSLKMMDLRDIYKLNESKSPQTTLIYTAPEVYYSPFTIQSDIYSAGILLTEMLIGFPLKEKIRDRHIDIHTVTNNLNCSTKLMDFLFKSTSFSPDDRFISIEEMFSSLDACPEFRKFRNKPLPNIKSSFIVGTKLDHYSIDHDLEHTNTSNLSAYNSHTTYLGNAFFAPARTAKRKFDSDANIQAYLLHSATNERISITSEEFRIGSNTSRVDFVPSSPNALSRTHAIIKYENGSFYITDCNSLNHTYINSVCIKPNKDHKIKTGDCIRLADQEFIFYENS